MTPEIFCATAVSPGLHLLPMRMDTTEARAMIVAVSLQESRLVKRRQVGGGSAHSYVQFERSGIKGVLTHKSTRLYLKEVCEALDVPSNTAAIHRAIEFLDPLAVVLARLLLWTLPLPLPGRTEIDNAWAQYVECWRPGKPHRATWDANFNQAWHVVEGRTT